MQTQPLVPTIDDVKRIETLQDPVIRNLQITQCYHELSTVLGNCTGVEANWCTFATWASKQAGQTIRKEDLERLLEHYLNQSQSAAQASQNLVAAVNVQSGGQRRGSQDSALNSAALNLTAFDPVALNAIHLTSAVDHASDAVGRGNKKVFAEIGYEFARFYQTCSLASEIDAQKLADFCKELRPGDPPDGQDYLRQAFTHYSQALAETNLKTRAEFILLANLEIGFHEQTRLQPEIAEAMDAGLISFLEFARPLFRSIFPLKGWFHLAHLYLMRLLGRPTALDLAVQALLTEVRVQLRRLITETMMTISLPSGVVLQLGQDITASFPDSLKQISSPELSAFLEKHDLSPDSARGTGALDWADLPERLNYIIGLFRCYQEHSDLFGTPFTSEQIDALNEGRLPSGSL